MVAREALVSKLSQKVEASTMVDVESRVGFPTFQQFSEFLGTDLSEKTAKAEREKLMLTHKEVLTLKEEVECSTVEEFVIEIGENTNEF
jgi:hypothetical protein